jgi:hypothetical protein
VTKIVATLSSNHKGEDEDELQFMLELDSTGRTAHCELSDCPGVDADIRPVNAASENKGNNVAAKKSGVPTKQAQKKKPKQ